MGFGGQRHTMEARARMREGHLARRRAAARRHIAIVHSIRNGLEAGARRTVVDRVIAERFGISRRWAQQLRLELLDTARG